MEFLKTEVLDFLKSQIDKILLCFLIVFFICVLLHIMHHQADTATSPVIPWLEKSIDLVTGSLITLITGQIFRKQSDKP